MSDIRALIFDCDGTIAHTMPLHWRAWNATTVRYGLVFPEERFYALGGVPARQIGWMSQFGQRIPLPLAGSGEYTCPHTGRVYRLAGNRIETSA